MDEGCVVHPSYTAPGVAFPEQLGRSTIFSHFNTSRDAVVPHNVDPVTLHYRLTNGHGVGRLDLHRPVNRAVFGVEGLQRITVPNQQLLRPSNEPDDRRTVSGLSSRSTLAIIPYLSSCQRQRK